MKATQDLGARGLGGEASSGVGSECGQRRHVWPWGPTLRGREDKNRGRNREGTVGQGVWGGVRQLWGLGAKL